jgi:hypothetical protein
MLTHSPNPTEIQLSETVVFRPLCRNIRWLSILLAVVTSMSAQGGLLVYIDDASTAGIDVVIADGKKAGETIDWLSNDKELVSLRTTLSDSSIGSEDGVIGLTTEADGGTWALLKSFLPNFDFDPGFAAKSFQDSKTGASGVALDVDVRAGKIAEGIGKVHVWGTQTFVNAFSSGILSADASGVSSEGLKDSRILFTGAIDPSGYEFGTSNGFAGSPTFTRGKDGLDGFSYANRVGVSLDSSSMYSVTAGISLALMSGDALRSNFIVQAVVPEPASMVLWGVAGVTLLGFQRRRKQLRTIRSC